LLEGKGRNGYFHLGAVEVGIEPGNPQGQMSIDFMAVNTIGAIGPSRITGEPGEILALATKIKRMVMAAMGNPAEDFTDRAELEEILNAQADSDAAYRAVMSCAKLVILHWDTGDLAGAVRALAQAVKDVEGR